MDWEKESLGFLVRDFFLSVYIILEATLLSFWGILFNLASVH